MLLAVCREFGIEHDEAVIPDIAFGFAGGIGNTGAVCGAVAGAIMAMGLKLGRADTVDGVLSNLGLAREFRSRFEAEMGNIGCRELTGLDLTKVEEMGKLMDSDIVQEVCFKAVATAYRVVVEMLRETDTAA